MIKCPEPLSKTLILEKTSQEQIFARFGLCPTNKHIKNPIRNDKSAKCYFYVQKNTGIVYFVDKAYSIHWDCFNYVQNIYHCDFFTGLKIIAEAFNIESANYELGKIDITRGGQIIIQERKYEKILRDSIKKSIDFNDRDFNKIDDEYWEKYGISRNTLKFYNVFPILSLWFNNGALPLYTYKEHNPAYAYVFPNDFRKVYFPLRIEKKWMSNCDNTVIQGLKQLPKENKELLIITKSLKDVMCLYELGYYAIAPQSETGFPKDLIERAKTKFNRIILFFDNDETGIRMSNEISKEYNIDNLILPFDEPKDISDYIKKHNKEKAKQFLEENNLYSEI